MIQRFRDLKIQGFLVEAPKYENGQNTKKCENSKKKCKNDKSAKNVNTVKSHK